MSDGFIYWYRQGWGTSDARETIEALEGAGFLLGNPGNGLITLVTNGPDSWGEQMPVARQELIESAGLVAADEVNFQLWLNADTDVFTRIRRGESRSAVLEFGLDGLTVAEREWAIGAVARVLRGDLDHCVGFVVDRRGVTEEEDWDSVVWRRAPLTCGWPDILGVRSESVAAHIQLAQAEGYAEPPLTFFGQRFGEL
ncbi:hypothetical protein [Streptomyces sp. Rer75]|uniref:hypothetical protein n=1 Tax=unclassified Streptomyces TaxID=2593676 RepID=UPI0015D09A4F|nr:hypothetical protein [Streptomyces sp. Rer75]QLH24266.1 hypothetical protein HYQ63_29555 [Streptomyces sp. Rer75]